MKEVSKVPRHERPEIPYYTPPPPRATAESAWGSRPESKRPLRFGAERKVFRALVLPAGAGELRVLVLESTVIPVEVPM